MIILSVRPFHTENGVLNHNVSLSTQFCHVGRSWMLGHNLHQRHQTLPYGPGGRGRSHTPWMIVVITNIHHTTPRWKRNMALKHKIVIERENCFQDESFIAGSPIYWKSLEIGELWQNRGSRRTYWADTIMDYYHARGAGKCKLFILTLKGATMTWLKSLPDGSMGS